MGIVARMVGERGQIFAISRSIVGLRDEESRKYVPFSHHRSRFSHNPTAS